MRIAFIVNGFPILSETFILNQITGLLDRGHDVYIFPQNRWNEPKVHGDVAKYKLLERTHPLALESQNRSALLSASYLIVKNAYKIPRLFLKGILKMLKSLNFLNFLKHFYPAALLLDLGPFDIIHCHFGSNGNYAVKLKRMGAFQGKIITTFHGHDITKHIVDRGPDIYKTLFNKGDLFMSVSRLFKERLIELGCNEAKVIIHRTGVDTGRFCYSSRSRKNGQTLRVVTIARLVEMKGIEYGIHAIAKLLKKYEDLEYKIAGDGPLKDDLQDLIESLNADEKITLLGWQNQEEIIELYHNADVLLAPSVVSRAGNQEGIPVALMEALSQGIPVISTCHSGIPELIRDGESGFLVPERDVDALAEKLEYLVTTS